MIYVFDIDGTICFNGKFIESRLRDAIHQLAQRHTVIFASARPIRDLIPVVKDYQDHCLIGGNGSIVSQNGEIKVMDYIPNQLFEKIIKLISIFDLDFIIDSDFDYVAKVKQSNKIFQQLDPDNLASNIGIHKVKQPIKIILVDIKERIFDEVRDALQKFRQHLSINVHEDDNNIDITAKEINKYTTLKKMIGEQNYIAFGNDINDAQLLKYAQKSIFVTAETSKPEHYDTVIKNNADSVAEIIERLSSELNSNK
ncbi:HAD family phosphatase [Staphylococcus xylosus]|uniref:HAD hydrolase family protein n=1 Tax=Staphylococcus TaxID=1279 RepID=UPI000E6A7297|nr:HAD family hydrolase [Staphylococcus xylosus]RIM79015.1 HAD family phosphatase [Staphylococcus xylosus]